MATYKVGKVKINGNGLMTGTGTNWTAANALVRVGATVVLATNPVRIYTVGSIISATSIQLSDWGSDAAITTDTNYSILLHDGLTVQGLAQDTAETLRYYRNFEQTLGDASKLNVGEAPGNLMKVGAFGLGGKGKTIPQKATGNELMKALKDIGCTWWRAPAVSNPINSVQIYGHGSGFFSYCGDTMAAINVDYSTGKMIVLSSNEGAINGGNEPKKVNVFSTAQLPDINNDTTGRLAISSGGTGANSADGALKNLGVYDYIPVKRLPTTAATPKYVEIGSIVDSGAGGGWISFWVAGSSGYGNGRMDAQLVTISARGAIASWNSGNPRTIVTSKLFVGADNRGNASNVKFGLTRVNNNTFRIFAKIPPYIGDCRLTILGGMANGGGGANNFIQGWIANSVDTPPEYTTEPADIRYVAPDKMLDDWMSPRHEAVFQNVMVNQDSGGEARFLFNVNDLSSQRTKTGAQLRSTFTNGNLVISSGNNKEVDPTWGKVFIRTTGTSDSSKEFRFDTDGSALAAGGQWKNSSDIRLKKNFKPIESPLESVMSFRGARFEMRASGSKAIGILAQDIEGKCPDAIGYSEVEIEGEVIKDAMNVDTAGISAAYSVEALKEVVKLMDLMLENPEAASARIKALKAMINDDLPE